MKALEEAVDFAWDVGIWNAHFECDSQLLSNAIICLSSPQVAICNTVFVIDYGIFDLYKFHMLSKTVINQSIFWFNMPRGLVIM